MKTIITSILLLTFITSTAQDTSTMRGKWGQILFDTARTEHSSSMMYEKYNGRRTLEKNMVEVAYKNKDSAWVMLDTSAFRIAMEFYDMANKEMNKCWRELETGQYAMVILNYIRMNGTVSDKKKFDKAVKEYQKNKLELDAYLREDKKNIYGN